MQATDVAPCMPLSPVCMTLPDQLPVSVSPSVPSSSPSTASDVPTEASVAAVPSARLSGITRTLAEAAAEARDWLRRHPLMGAGAAGVSLLLGAGAAYAVATPTLSGPVTVRHVREQVQPLFALDEQEAALQAHPSTFYRSTETRESDTASTLLSRLGVSDAAAEDYLRATPEVRTTVLGLQRRLVQAAYTSDLRLQSLRVQWLDAQDPHLSHLLVIERDATSGTFGHRTATEVADVQPALATVPLGGNFFRDAAAAQVPTAVAEQVLRIFDPVVDTARMARKGDHLTVVYEQISLGGQVVGHGRVLSATEHVAGKDYRVVWFPAKGTANTSRTPVPADADLQAPAGDGQTADATPEYFTPEGHSLADRPVYRAPVPGALVTSPFEPYRIHPLFGTARPHTGIDLGAPVGTPVHVAADGRVRFAGEQMGYGNVIIVEHGKGRATLYAHLSRMDVRAGQRVRAEDVIGAVGTSGWTTGPHLHFETRVRDVPMDPQVALKEGHTERIAAGQRAAFRRVVTAAERDWHYAQDALPQTQVARAD